jgi:hypothetical protein
MKTTRWEKCGFKGNVKANWFDETVTRFVRHGLPGRITLNMAP